jgi:flagellar biosynthesis protein FlhA
VHPDRLLAMSTGNTLAEIQGLLTRDPVFGRPAHWIMPATADQARAAGYTVFDAAVVIATHFERVVRDHIESLFGRAELDAVLAYLNKLVPKLVEELTPKLLPLTTVHTVLNSLLAEHVPIRDLRTIVGALIDGAATTQDPAPAARNRPAEAGRLHRANVFGAVDELKVMALEPDLEQLLQEVIRLSSGTGAFGIEPGLAGELRAMAAAAAARFEATRDRPPRSSPGPSCANWRRNLLRPVRRAFGPSPIPRSRRKSG